MKAPVAFLIFRRPDTTEKVFEAIRQAKPLKLLVILDGSRKLDSRDIYDDLPVEVVSFPLSCDM